MAANGFIGDFIVRERTENTTAKINMTNGKTTIYKLLHRKLKIEQHEPH